uniref:Disease resistance protein RPS2 n=1 Tax=Cajanus cajan TaxID=3821 RepID=A0A151RKC7_CAJCA|nr:Disease resistance protein RPS2 [Cajanus cajan]
MELKMLFNIDGTISHSTELLQQLDELILNDLPNLTQIINKEIVKFYQNLKILQVKNCESLEWLPISQVLKNMEITNCTALHKIMIIQEEEGKRVPFFLNLVSLFIIHCHCLKSLFSLSQAQNLKKLKILRLCNCEKVEEVISSDKGEMVATIFPKMKCLVLKDLPKLVNFCQEGGCSNWPNLQTVRVNNIPSMKTFLRDDLNTPLLKSVYITFAKKLWVGNLNKTISCMHNNPDGHAIYFTQMKELKLIEIYELTEIWFMNPKTIFGLENLQLIHIKSFPSLIRLFYYYATEKLHQLIELNLEACESLTDLVYSYSNEIPAAKFPSLTKVELKSLSRLKWFFICGVELPSLKTLTIKKCPQLTSSTIIDGKSFFELNELTLRSCDKLVVIVSSKTLQELGKLKKLILDELILNDLPNLTQIINKEIVELYQNLKILKVKSCESLKWLPISQVLKNVKITNCMALHKIMIIHEEEGMRGKTTFSHLKDVSLVNLLNLPIAFPIAAKFASLETLKIENCPSLKTLVEESNEEKDHPELDNSNYFFPNSVSFFTLIF